MARIPVYDSNDRMTTEAPRVRVSPNVYAQEGANIAGLGETVTTVADQIHKAAQTVEYTRAQAQAAQAMNELNDELVTDTQYGDMPERYQKKLADKKSQIVKGIADPAIRGIVEAEFDNDSMQALTKVKTYARKLMVDDGQANLAISLDQNAKLYANATTSQEKEKILAGTAALLDANRQNRIITGEDYAKTMIRLKENFAFTDASTLIKRDPKLGVELIEAGHFKNLDTKDKDALLKKGRNDWFLSDLSDPAVADEGLKKNVYGFDVAEKEKAQNIFDREKNKIQNENEDDVLNVYLDGSLTESKVKELHDQGKIDAKFAVSMINKLNSGSSFKTDPIAYMEAVDVVVSPDMTAKSKREYLLEQLKNKVISDTDFKNLYKTGLSGGPSVATMYMAEKMDESEKLQNASRTPRDINWLKSSVDMIKSSDILNTNDVAATTIRLMEAIGSDKLEGKSIAEKALSLVKDTIIAKYPVVAFMKDMPNKIFDGTEVKSVYAGDNELEEDKQYHPQKDGLEIGDTVAVGEKEYRVVGFDNDGEPLIESE